MKFLKNILALFLFCMLAARAVWAQGYFDEFSVPRTILVTPIKLQTGNVGWSNNPIDLRNCIGVGKLDLAVLTNGAAGGTTIHIYTSNDQTNWTTLANCCVVTNATSLISTNTYYAASFTATNGVMLPGVITTPTAAVAGFATPYLLPQTFTNIGTIAANAGGHYMVGFIIGDANRYLSVEYDGAATSTNIYHGVFTGHFAR